MFAKGGKMFVEKCLTGYPLAKYTIFTILMRATIYNRQLCQDRKRFLNDWLGMRHHWAKVSECIKRRRLTVMALAEEEGNIDDYTWYRTISPKAACLWPLIANITYSLEFSCMAKTPREYCSFCCLHKISKTFAWHNI